MTTTTTYWRITTVEGVDYGVFAGETPAHALLAMHRDAGEMDLSIRDGEIVWLDDEQRRTYGDVDDWIIREERGDSCPVCGGPMPTQEQARRVSYRGHVVCDNAECESSADDVLGAR